jgi:hypothetical protein
MRIHEVNVVNSTAEEVGFEPTVTLRPQRFSRPSDSSTLALLQVHFCNLPPSSPSFLSPELRLRACG